MDEVWVPTSFQKRVFEQGGVPSDKLIVIPEPVDVEFFSPLSISEPLPYPGERKEVRFLSVFKWEERKGWRFLLEAFLREFSSRDDVGLYLLTNAYHTEDNFESKIKEFISSLNITDMCEGGEREREVEEGEGGTENRVEEGERGEREEVGEEGGRGEREEGNKVNERREINNSCLPTIHIFPSPISTVDMPRLYAGASAFVLPSRGEGWGRPHVEAMSMALPVISTYWSGPEEYLTEENGYPLHIDGLDLIEDGHFKGHRWARPSITHLRELMRRVFSNREEARERGRVARETMVREYCPNCVAEKILIELERIKGNMEKKEKERREKLRRRDEEEREKRNTDEVEREEG